MAIVTAVDLVSVLRQSSILKQDQLEEVARLLQARFPEPRALARELLQRGWLTAYQVNQLLQGGGRNLVLPPYVVLERLGEGGTGQVFKARHQHLHRVVALKVIRPELLADAEVVNRFQREIQVASQVSHPNVVHAYDAGDLGGIQALVLEYIEGVSLDQLVKKSGPLAPGVACDYMRQAALGLQHIHECGLVHRDIKPSNLLLQIADSGAPIAKPVSGKSTISSPRTGIVKILDLGLARLQRSHDKRESSTITTIATVTMGTPDYMAPEQALEFHSADIRADLYSLGCTFYFLLTGRPPFPDCSMAQKLMRHQQSDPPPLAKLRPGLPSGLERIVSKLMAKKPRDRYQTPGEVAQALALLDASATARTAATTTLRAGRAARIAKLAGAAALLLVCVLAWRLLTPSSGKVAELASSGPAGTRPGPLTTPANRPTGPTRLPPPPLGGQVVLRGRGAVRDALIDFGRPDHKFGAEGKDNPLCRGVECGAFLVRFDLAQAPAKVEKATLSFFVWDPHDKSPVKVCAFGLLTPWDEPTVTWKQSVDGKPWKGGKNFAFGADTGPPGSHVVVLQEMGSDTVDPPLEYQLDVTPLVRSWLAGSTPNHGLAIAPVIDRAIDNGNQSRFQLYSSKHNRVQFTPTLTLQTQQ